MRWNALTTTGVLVALAVTACGSREAPAAHSPGQVKAADVARAPAGSASTDALVTGLYQLGGDLYRVSPSEDGNTVLSPLSVALAFSMVRVGARGQTAAELDRVLHLPATGRDEAFNRLMQELRTTDVAPPRPSPSATVPAGSHPAPPVLAIANALFLQQGQQVGSDFLRVLAADYGAGVRTVDFGSSRALATINDWVRRQTADRITRLFDSLDPATQLVLADAVYLKAQWREPFELETRSLPFTRPDGTAVSAPTMGTQTELRYASSSRWQAVELPYAGGTLAMWVIVPRKGAAVGDLLTAGTLTTVGRTLQRTLVDLSLPRWDLATDVDLAEALQRLGLRVPFSEQADFSGIARNLSITQAVHRANITVDEWGTEAAAVTGFAMGVSGMAPAPQPVVVKADHPFAFVIVDTASHAPVFLGSVGDPTAGS